jgi:hypothetical protein
MVKTARTAKTELKEILVILVIQETLEVRDPEDFLVKWVVQECQVHGVQ